MELRDILARNVRLRRAALRLTQEEVAHRAGIGRDYVSDIECSKYAATVDVIGQLAGALEIDPSELLQA